MTETLAMVTVGEIIAGVCVIAAVPLGIIVGALFLRSGQISQLERELEAIRQREAARANGHFGAGRLRERMRTVAEEDEG